jgi:hypothetical protein
MSAAKPKALSGTQQWALDWLVQHGPRTRATWRRAGIAARTMSSLQNAGLVASKSTEDPWQIVYYAVPAKVTGATQ